MYKYNFFSSKIKGLGRFLQVFKETGFSNEGFRRMYSLDRTMFVAKGSPTFKRGLCFGPFLGTVLLFI